MKEPCWEIQQGSKSFLYVEQEVYNVAVFHDVFLAFTANQTLCLGCGHGAAFLHVMEGNDLGTDKTTFKVGVDLTRGLRSLAAFQTRFYLLKYT